MKFCKLKNQADFLFGYGVESSFFSWSAFKQRYPNDKVIQSVQSLDAFIEKSEFLLPLLEGKKSESSDLAAVSVDPRNLDLPYQPRSFRDFYAYEEHVKNGRRSRGLDMIPEWYEFPVFYYSNHLNMKAPNSEVIFPKSAECLDFEMELGCIVGRRGRNLSLDQARESIFGYCLLNDFSARDVQKQEMKLNMGPAKGKDFASSFGPIIYTRDELEPKRKSKSFGIELFMKWNGKEVCRSEASAVYYSFEEMLVRASADCDLFPGELIGSGTLGGGSLMELNLGEKKSWLASGDHLSLGWSFDSFELSHRIA